MKPKYNPIFEYKPYKNKKNPEAKESWLEIIGVLALIFGSAFVWLIIGAAIGA